MSTKGYKREEVEQQEQGYHIPVLLHEAIEALNIHQEGVYVDCTFGGGGHSGEILKKLNSKGRLIAFDQDEDAKANLPEDNRVLFVPQNFRHLQRFLRLHGIVEVDGVLADLGVSSHQFDEADRGFSIRFDAPLDMRMNRKQQLTAYQVVQTYSAEQLHKMFEKNGEVTNSKTLAHGIVELRKHVNLGTTEAFKTALHQLVKGNPNKYFAQVFQALRIEVNDEMGGLREMLQQVPHILKPGGRVAVITFHSIEDRLVKQFFKQGYFGVMEDENPFTNNSFKNPLKLVNKKPVLPSDAELKRNSRSRSAKLRVAEKNS